MIWSQTQKRPPDCDPWWRGALEKTFTESRRRQLHYHRTDHRRGRSFYPSLKIDHLPFHPAITTGRPLLSPFHRTFGPPPEGVVGVDTNAPPPGDRGSSIPRDPHLPHE